MTNREAKFERMYVRAIDILEGRANGHALPILQALALRGYAPAQMYLSDLLIDGVEGRRAVERGRRWLRRAARTEATARYNLAVDWCNRGSLAGYRHWLARAAALDEESLVEVKRFETRFPQEAMRRWRRLRPERSI